MSFSNKDIILTTYYVINKKLNRNERKRIKDMRVKIYLYCYYLDETKFSIYRVHRITGS